MKTFITVLFVGFFWAANAQVDTIVWQRMTSLPDSNKIDISGYFQIDSDFYVVGGEVGFSSNCVSTVWKYHIPSDNWIQMRHMPFGPATSQCSFVLNNKGYFLTSIDSVNNFNCDTMFWEYDPTMDNWARKAGFPDQPRYNSSSFMHENKGYVACANGCTGADNHLWQYDPLLDKWIQLASLPDILAARRVAVASKINTAYFIGGENAFSGNAISDVMRYNILTDTWDSIGQMPGMPRSYAVFWGFDSLLIGGGGTDFSTLFNDFYRYDIFRNEWTPVVFQNSFDSSGIGATFIFQKRGYYFGGWSSVNPRQIFNNNMWSFDASKYFSKDTTVGIQDVKNDLMFSVYPNPVNRDKGFSIATSESGSIVFYDALGRLLDERKLVHGTNQLKLNNDNEVVFYKATMQNGMTENGKIVFFR